MKGHEMAIESCETDEGIVARVLSGNRQEFGVLVERYLGVVHAFAYARIGNHADAEDVAQETFLKAFRSLDTLRDRSRVGSWLMGVARHACGDFGRQRQRWARATSEAAHMPSSVAPDMAQRDMRDMVRRKLAELDESAREVLLLYYFSGKKIHEVADLLEIGDEAAAKRIQRAREALGDKLLDELGFVAEPERPKDERKRRAMAAILAVPASWDATHPPPAATSGAGSVQALITHHRLAILVAAAALVTVSALTAFVLTRGGRPTPAARPASSPTPITGTPEPTAAPPPTAGNKAMKGKKS
ncbi:MAG: RNA polymerase sigma factor [bacterium]|nr:RNA polymerase sigma factor [bacterium]